jgi:hypothetical protein
MGVKNIFKRAIIVILSILLNTVHGVEVFSQQTVHKKFSTAKEMKGVTIGVDLILYNAHVLTLDDAIPNAEALAIQDNRILAVGTDTDILALQGANTHLFDLE